MRLCYNSFLYIFIKEYNDIYSKKLINKMLIEIIDDRYSRIQDKDDLENDLSTYTRELLRSKNPRDITDELREKARDIGYDSILDNVNEVVVDSLVKNLLSVAVDGVLPNTLKPQQYLRIGLVFNFSDKSVKVGIRSTCIAINALINVSTGYPFGPHIVCNFLSSEIKLSKHNSDKIISNFDFGWKFKISSKDTSILKSWFNLI